MHSRKGARRDTRAVDGGLVEVDPEHSDGMPRPELHYRVCQQSLAVKPFPVDINRFW
jgi:hypothetical protein